MKESDRCKLLKDLGGGGAKHSKLDSGLEYS